MHKAPDLIASTPRSGDDRSLGNAGTRALPGLESPNLELGKLLPAFSLVVSRLRISRLRAPRIHGIEVDRIIELFPGVGEPLLQAQTFRCKS